MSKDLVIVESPTKARTLDRILGKEYKIMASMGHVRDLPERKLGIDIDNDFRPDYQTTNSRKKVIADLDAAARDADAIYLATDPDREGEAIAWHITELLKEQKDAGVFRRVAFHEITRNAVIDAFEHPERLNMNLVNAQQARRILDRLVGYQVSPLLWNRVEKGTSAGRVQSVALRLICEREAEINGFESKEYWNFNAFFQKPGKPKPFASRLHRLNGEKVDVTTGEFANELADAAKQGRYRVCNVEKTPKQRRPAPPFITSTLQQAASSNLRFSTNQTMRIAQQLYEGIDTGAGLEGLITYMRTDSVNVAKEAQASACAYVGEAFGDEYVPSKPNVYKSKKSAQEAHEAIRPTDVRLTPKKAEPFLDSKQQRLYHLIWDRFVASQMPPAKTLQYSVELENHIDLPETGEGESDKGGGSSLPRPHHFLFRSTVTTITFQGYLKVYDLSDVEVEEESDGESDYLPELTVESRCDLVSVEAEQKFTQPPTRYSEAMLVRELENNGIGRPSTYASIVNTIQVRKYVGKEKGKLYPNELGTTVNAYLTEKMPNLFEVSFTARMEDELDTVEQGEREWEQMIRDFYSDFSQWLQDAKLVGGPDKAAVERLLAIFPDDLRWQAPRKVGRRTYDDKRFHQSLKGQLSGGKALTERQWVALINLALRYEEQLPEFSAVIPELDIADVIQELRAKREQQAAEAALRLPGEEAQRLAACLESVSEWEEPVTRGKRVYDDRKFYESLSQQVDAGRSLSQAQTEALKKLIIRYREQVANFNDIQKDFQLPQESIPAESQEEIQALMAVADEIKEWKAPSGKGRRKFDDQSFVDSLRKQFITKRSLSLKQLTALRKVFSKYKEQIENFEKRVGAVESQGRGSVEKTDVDCPACKNGKLVARRNASFYGCENFPKCKYTINSLESGGVEAKG